MLNIVMPIAGRGHRFREAGYTVPKPLIPVHGRPMVEMVVENIRPSRPHRFIFLALREHLDQFRIDEVLQRAAPDCIILPVSQVTEGATCTVLLARDYLQSSDPLMIANGDQWVGVDIDRYLDALAELDGLIMTMRADHPKWSYAAVDESGRVVKVAEKQPISNEATVGIYSFARGRDFVRGAEQMMAKNLRVNNEFYVCPVYNELIGWGAKVGVYNVGWVGVGMSGLGTPEDLELFLKRPGKPGMKTLVSP